MSYITNNLSPYRNKDLGKEFFEILEEDCEKVCSSLKERGLLFIIAFITIMSLSILKAVIHIITQLQKPVMTYPHLSLYRGMKKESITGILVRREAIPEIETHDNMCPNDTTKVHRFDKIDTLRRYLYENNLTLHAKVIKTINHRVSEEELAEMYRKGQITKPLSTTYITFGNELNALLKEVLGNVVDLRKDRFSDETHIIIPNDDYFPLKESLRNLYNEKIQIKFD